MNRTYAALVTETADSEAIELLAAEVEGFGLTAIEELAPGRQRAFFLDAASRDRAAALVRQRFPDMHVSVDDVPDENWAARSQASLKAVRVHTLTVAPPWDIAGSDPAQTVVILPSMGFGTGHHATTCLCLRAMQEIGVAGKSLIDAGTGSGVLALAALKLGASRVAAVDNDPDAIANAQENAALNHVALDTRCGDLAEPAVTMGTPFDVVTANLTGATLERFASLLEGLAPEGTLIVSGLREEEDAAVRTAFSRTVRMRYELDGWLCLVL